MPDLCHEQAENGVGKHCKWLILNDFFPPSRARLAWSSASAARITIAVTDYTSSLFVPHLLPLLRREAPGMEVTFIAPDQSRVREGLEGGDYDLMIGYLVDLSEGLRATELYRDAFACIVASDHPVIREGLDLAGYAAAAHVRRGTATSNPFTLEMIVDRALEAQGCAATRGAAHPNGVRSGSGRRLSDLVGSLAKTGARQYARIFDIRVLELPFEIATTPTARWSGTIERISRTGCGGFARRCVVAAPGSPAATEPVRVVDITWRALSARAQVRAAARRGADRVEGPRCGGWAALRRTGSDCRQP